MKHLILPLIFLFFSIPAFAQGIFQAFDVDQAATPRGGQAMLDLFLQVNMRFPLRAEADHVNGRVFIQGIVEPDGSLTHATVLGSLRPDCDQEALRLMTLFKAWQPAQKDGRPVRQQVTIPVLFKSALPVYISNRERIDFYAKDGRSVTESSPAAVLKRIALIDTLGLPAGDIIFMEKVGKKWQRLMKTRYKLTRHENEPVSPYDTVREGTQVDFLDEKKRIEGNSYGFYRNGEMAFMKPYVHNNIIGALYYFHPNGVVAERSVYTPAEISQTFWYPNGQIRAVETIDRTTNISGSLYTTGLVSQWDSNGRKLVTDGKGTAVYTSWRVNPVTNRYTVFTETGRVDDRRRQGLWRGTSADGSYTYQENYQFGELTTGWAVTTGEDTVRYTVLEQAPVLKGDQQESSNFLAKSIRFPYEAVMARPWGSIVIGFTVNTDGSIQNLTVLQSVGFDLDEECMRVVRLTNKKWIPGYQRGKPVSVNYKLPFNFSTKGVMVPAHYTAADPFQF